jgi:hypothetical protein
VTQPIRPGIMPAAIVVVLYLWCLLILKPSIICLICLVNIMLLNQDRGKEDVRRNFIYKHAVSGCLLHYYSSAVEHNTLRELFGVPPSTFSRVMSAAAESLRKALRQIPEARIQFPDQQTQVRWAAICNAKEPLVHGVWGFVDGKNYRVQAPSVVEQQNAMYNGITMDAVKWNIIWRLNETIMIRLAAFCVRDCNALLWC